MNSDMLGCLIVAALLIIGTVCSIVQHMKEN